MLQFHETRVPHREEERINSDRIKNMSHLLKAGAFQQKCFIMTVYFLLSDISHSAFVDIVSVSCDETSLSSPEVLRRLECSEDRLPERFHASVLGSRLSELSALNSTGLDIPRVKTSPRVVMEPPHSRTITPEPATQSTHSPGSVSMSDNFSILDSLDADKVRGLMVLYMLLICQFCKKLLVVLQFRSEPFFFFFSLGT